MVAAPPWGLIRCYPLQSGSLREGMYASISPILPWPQEAFWAVLSGFGFC